METFKIQSIPFYKNALIFRKGTVKKYLSDKEIEENQKLIVEIEVDFLPFEFKYFDFFVGFEVLAFQLRVRDEPDFHKPILDNNFYKPNNFSAL